MDSLIKILNDSITGIIYFSALFFFFLRFIKVDDLHLRWIIRDNKDVMLYFFVLVVFISRIIGGMAENIMSAKMLDLTVSTPQFKNESKKKDGNRAITHLIAHGMVIESFSRHPVFINSFILNVPTGQVIFLFF